MKRKLFGQVKNTLRQALWVVYVKDYYIAFTRSKLDYTPF